MPRPAEILATVGGAGYAPIAPGTVGSLVGLGLGLMWPAPLLVILAFLAGVVVSGETARRLKRHDPACVVIDECVGMWGVLAWLPQLRSMPGFVLLAFGLFRFFDIRKPFFLRQVERLPGGWGIMLDDVGAAACTALVLWVLLAIRGLA